MKCGLFLICLIILIKNSDELNCKRDRNVLVNPELKLKYDLFCEYESGVLPERNLQVIFDLTPVHLYYNNWDDDTNVKVKFECNLTYTDKNLKWVTTDHNNIEAITVDGVEDIKLWMPKISFDETVDTDNALEKCATLGCTIRSNGGVYCEFICNIMVPCTSIYRRWPFDMKYCSLDIFSHYNENEIRFNSTPSDMETLRYMKNSYWQIFIGDRDFYSGYTKFTELINGTKMETFDFTMTRYSSQDLNTIVAPLLIFSVVNILIFTADLRSGIRILLLLLSILSHVSYMPMLSWIIPKDKDRIPYVVLYFIDSTVLSMILFIETVLLRKIGKSNDGPLSGFGRKMTSVVDDNLFGWFFVLNPEYIDVHGDLPVLRAIQITHKSPENLKWWQYVKVIDRFCLLIVLAFYLTGIFMDLRYRLL